MDFQALRIELHRCCDLNEITGWLLDHANELCAEYASDDYPVRLSYNQFISDAMQWRFYLWCVGIKGFCEVFLERVLPALGFYVTLIACAQDPMNGSDAYIVMVKYDWPMMQYVERLSR